MAAIDIFLIIIIISSSLFGLIRGFVASALSLLGWILSFYLTFITFPLIEPYLESKIANVFAIKIFGYSALLIVYLIFFGILNLSLNLATKVFRGNMFNRAIGLIFGFARGIALVMFILFAYHLNFTALHGIDYTQSKISSQIPEFYKKGKIASYIGQYAEKSKNILPENVEMSIVEFYDRITNSSQNERFVEYAVIRLEKNLNSEIKAKIRDKINSQDDDLSKEKLDLLNLKLSYSEYVKLDEDSIKHPLTDEDISKIDSIVLGIEQSSLKFLDD